LYFTGTLSVTYLVCFVITNAAKWGINVEFGGDGSQKFYAPGNCNALYNSRYFNVKIKGTK
jgi:hypothetical protein